MNQPAEALNQSRPLVVWDNVTVCDRCGGDVHVTTDGMTVTAETIRSHIYWAADDPERDGTLLSVRCGQQTPDGPEAVCGGTVTVDLSTEWWTTNRILIDRLMAEGVDIP